MSEENFLNFVKEDLLNEDEPSQDYESQVDSYIQFLSKSECFHHNHQTNCQECQILNSNRDAKNLVEDFKDISLNETLEKKKIVFCSL